MKKICSIAICILIAHLTMAQGIKPATSTAHSFTLNRPKLVVGIVVDQMRWDFLYRYANRYSNNGFKRLLGEGFSCENTFIPYTPTVTAAGHTCIYTGSVPAIHGIVGNDWFDKNTQSKMYCSEDASVNTCLLYTSPSPRDRTRSRMPSSA